LRWRNERGVPLDEALFVLKETKMTPRTLTSAIALATALFVAPAAMAAGGHSHHAAAASAQIVDVVRDPADLPPAIGRRKPQHVKVDFETTEVTGQLNDGTTFHYWTFNSKVPGPFLRVRVGDTVEVSLKNADDSAMMHNVDFHAVTGPGGGAGATMAAPGETKGFVFKALNPGLYVYHCATPMVAQHIANGMYGLILVEPEEGLPKVDREFYVMQGELYTEQPFGTKGEATESYDKLLAERPEYFLFNGAVGALTKQKPLTAKVGETVRVYFGVGGPNYTSSFHVIGEIFDKVYTLGDLRTTPLKDVQTISVPPGGAAAVEFKLEVPGRYVLVDHALSRAERGLVGFLNVEGPPAPEIFSAPTEIGSGDAMH
jgi:nitrite reductase (NO-forming)